MLVCSSYSYSEEIFGTTQNAANAGLNWVMQEVLPAQAGLTVNTVIYRYTAVKDPATGMVVYVQNENAEAPGYIFREADDWSGLPGNTISKAIPVANIPKELWGDGSIEVEGEGEVTNPLVIYGYQYDPCFDPQTDPSCPGYKDPFEIPGFDINVKNPLDDDFIQDEIDRKATLRDEDQEDRDRKKVASDDDDADDERLEQVLGIVNDTLIAAEAAAIAAELTAMNYIPQSYYTELPSTEYVETVSLKGGELPDNTRGRRVNFAQQLLHEKMVEMQYKQ